MSRIFEQMERPPLISKREDAGRVEFMNTNASYMRAFPTHQEKLVADEINKRGLRGYKNQEQLFGRYIGDFCHRSTKSVFEIDGNQHTENGFSNDAKRDYFLMGKNYTVTRYTNDEVESDVVAVVDSMVLTVKLKRIENRDK